MADDRDIRGAGRGGDTLPQKEGRGRGRPNAGTGIKNLAESIIKGPETGPFYLSKNQERAGYYGCELFAGILNYDMIDG
jgi:hypothetical protein